MRRAPTTSSSFAAGPTPASSRRPWSAPGRACPTRRRSCRSPTSRIRRWTRTKGPAASRWPSPSGPRSGSPSPRAVSGPGSMASPSRIAAAGPTPGPVPSEPAARRVAQRQAVADRIARRARQVFGLTDTLAAPLTSSDSVIGAIVLSRRREGGWSATTRRILAGAAVEASSALSRAYSLRAAEAQAATDALTGLPNRRYFDEFCGLLARRRRSDDAVGVLMIDIDRFKVLNDTHGHATGDEVLRAVGGAIVARRPRGRRARPIRRRGVRRPAPEPEPGDRPRGRRAGPLLGRRASTFAGSASMPSASRSGSPSRCAPTSRSTTSSPRRTGRSTGPSAAAGTASSPPDRARRRRLTRPPTSDGRRLPSGS